MAESASIDEKGNFLKEMRIFTELKSHSNIIGYFGQVSIGPEWLIATEYCSNGNLAEYMCKVSIAAIDFPFTNHHSFNSNFIFYRLEANTI